MKKPLLFIITGANGAGKSTLANFLLPIEFESLEVFDGDKAYLEHFRALLKLGNTEKESRNIAGEYVSELFDKKVEKALENKETFAYEGHLHTPESYNIPRYFKENGYEIHLSFLGLDSIEQAVERVHHRAKLGGHNVPYAEIALRYDGNMYFLNKYFEEIDFINIFDASDIENLQQIIAIENGKITYTKRALPTWFIKGFPSIISKI